MALLEFMFAFCEHPRVVGAMCVVFILSMILITPHCEKEPPKPKEPLCSVYSPKISLKVWGVEAPIQLGTKCK